MNIFLILAGVLLIGLVLLFVVAVSIAYTAMSLSIDLSNLDGWDGKAVERE